jgi:DnaJ-class molecular chaperone
MYEIKTKEGVVNTIARRILSMETLETRRSDSLDFKEHAVWSIKKALEMAFEAGIMLSPMAEPKATCPRCGGNGMDDPARPGSAECIRCEGTGQISRGRK